jgi:DNA-binding response OmpR family regulator
MRPAPPRARDRHISNGRPSPRPRILGVVRDAALILVIEDDPAIADAIRARLAGERYTVEVAADGLSGVATFERLDPDLVVLDVLLPGIDGIEVCRRIQRHRPVPVLMLTARDAEVDVVIGLGVGADDYMTKPFSPRELVARVQALLRRRDRVDYDRPATALVVGTVELDPVAHLATRDGAPVHLTATELELAVFLASHPNTVYGRDQLLTAVWRYADAAGARTVDSHVRSLRRKLGSDFVRTVHGVGYGLGRPAT